MRHFLDTDEPFLSENYDMQIGRRNPRIVIVKLILQEIEDLTFIWHSMKVIQESKNPRQKRESFGERNDKRVSYRSIPCSNHTDWKWMSSSMSAFDELARTNTHHNRNSWVQSLMLLYCFEAFMHKLSPKTSQSYH